MCWDADCQCPRTAFETPGHVEVVRRLPSSALYGVGALVVAGLLAWSRRWAHLQVMMFTLPLAASGLLIYSGMGVTYYNVYQLVAFAIGLDWLLGAVAESVQAHPLGARAPAGFRGDCSAGTAFRSMTSTHSGRAVSAQAPSKARSIRRRRFAGMVNSRR